MFITSLGIYGFLTDAFNKQSLMIEQADRQVKTIDNKISINKTRDNGKGKTKTDRSWRVAL
jgi:hypothetical protein